MKTNTTILQEVRFQMAITLSKIDKALKDPNVDKSPSKSFAMAKRSALDLKSELTKLTQSSKYLWNS